MTARQIVDRMAHVMTRQARTGWTPALRKEFDRLDQRICDLQGGTTARRAWVHRRHLAASPIYQEVQPA